MVEVLGIVPKIEKNNFINLNLTLFSEVFLIKIFRVSQNSVFIKLPEQDLRRSDFRSTSLPTFLLQILPFGGDPFLQLL